mgnify:FL=1
MKRIVDRAGARGKFVFNHFPQTLPEYEAFKEVFGNMIQPKLIIYLQCDE